MPKQKIRLILLVQWTFIGALQNVFFIRLWECCRCCWLSGEDRSLGHKSTTNWGLQLAQCSTGNHTTVCAVSSFCPVYFCLPATLRPLSFPSMHWPPRFTGWPIHVGRHSGASRPVKNRSYRLGGWTDDDDNQGVFCVCSSKWLCEVVK